MKNKTDILFTIVIAVLTFILIISSISTISDIRGNKFTNSASTMYYAVQSKNYYRLPEYKIDNVFDGVKYTEEYKEAYAIADYFTAASMYRAYCEVEKSKEAKQYYELMQESLTNMGEFTYAADEINEQLGITKDMLEHGIK